MNEDLCLNRRAFDEGAKIIFTHFSRTDHSRTTPEQIKMFLTRMGFGSKVVVTGDLTQTDLPYGQRSGLSTAIKILNGIDDIAIHFLSEKDVVRHHLVQKIILAYDAYDRGQVV